MGEWKEVASRGAFDFQVVTRMRASQDGVELPPDRDFFGVVCVDGGPIVMFEKMANVGACPRWRRARSSLTGADEDPVRCSAQRVAARGWRRRCESSLISSRVSPSGCAEPAMGPSSPLSAPALCIVDAAAGRRSGEAPPRRALIPVAARDGSDQSRRCSNTSYYSILRVNRGGQDGDPAHLTGRLAGLCWCCPQIVGAARLSAYWLGQISGDHVASGRRRGMVLGCLCLLMALLERLGGYGKLGSE
jgi:hypothetical protein